jgi:hypothetical protein
MAPSEAVSAVNREFHLDMQIVRFQEANDGI